MCEHQKDTQKKMVFVSGLCKQCSAQERFDAKQLQDLVVSQAKKDIETYRKVFLKGGRHGLLS